ncbi:MAG: EAL domain-containing protein [Gammaproteobacteria bacterium]
MKRHSKTDWYLEGSLGQNNIVAIPLNIFPFVIGRHEDCHLSVNSLEMSRRHALIDRCGDLLELSDLGSTNGTYINRMLIARPTPIKEGDVIHFGSVEFRVKFFRKTPKNFRPDNGSTRMLQLDSPEVQLPQQFVSCEKEFMQLLDQKMVCAYSQPILSLKTHEVIAHEVLGRGTHPDLPEDPGSLFLIAEKMGYAELLSRTIRSVASEIARASVRYPMLFLNSHPKEMFRPEMIASLEQIRAMAPGLPLVMEIHEKAITQVHKLKELMADFDRLDIKLAYDDFGAGQARLNELIEIPPDFLKFDISLIRDIDKIPKKQELVRVLVRMCDNLNIFTLAEGVETVEEAKVCEQVGFTFVQGYLYGKPSPMSV